MLVLIPLTKSDNGFVRCTLNLIGSNKDMGKNDNNKYKIIADNRQARYQYHILETYEAGIELMGTEVKSIRAGKCNVRDSYALIRDGQA